MALSRKRSSGDPNLLTTREAAAYLGVTERTVFTMANRGDITPLAPEGDYLRPPVRYFLRAELDTIQQRRWSSRELVPYLTPKRRAALAAQQDARPTDALASSVA